MHGGKHLKKLAAPDTAAVSRGLPNLEKHIQNIRRFGKTPIVALNRFEEDNDDELRLVADWCDELDVPFAVSDHFVRGGAGAIELARTVVANAEKHTQPFTPLYDLDIPVREKIRAVAMTMYGAADVVLTKDAERDLLDVHRLGFEKLPVCIAKTPNSLTDDPKLVGRPKGFDVTVRNIQINAGAGFLVALTGDILRMPGLPRKPRSESMDLQNGQITGL